MQNKLNGAILNYIAFAVGIMLQVGQLYYMTKYVEPHEFAKYTIVTLLYGIIYTISELGLNSAAQQMQSIEDNDTMSSLLSLSLLITNLIAIVAMKTLNLIHEENYIDIETIILIIINLNLSVIYSQNKAIGESMFKFNSIAIIEILRLTMGFIIYISLLSCNVGWKSVFYAMVVGNTMANLVSWHKLTNRRNVKLSFDFKKIRNEASFGKSHTISLISSQSLAAVEIMLYTRLYGEYSAGIYSIARNIVTQVYQGIGGVLTKMYYIKICKLKEIGFGKEGLKFMAINLAVVSFVYLILYTGKHEIIESVLGAKYIEVEQILGLFLILGVIRLLINNIANIFAAMGMPDLNMKINVAYLIASIVTILGVSKIIYKNVFIELQVLISLLILIIYSYFYLIEFGVRHKVRQG